MRSIWRVGAEGNATAEIAIHAKGDVATQLQYRLAQVPPDMGGKLVRKILENACLRGTDTARYPTVQRDQLTQSLDRDIDATRAPS